MPFFFTKHSDFVSFDQPMLREDHAASAVILGTSVIALKNNGTVLPLVTLKFDFPQILSAWMCYLTPSSI